jgi:hypothetical protein
VGDSGELQGRFVSRASGNPESRLREEMWGSGEVAAERIAALMAGRSTEETKRMLFEGVEMVARQGGGEVVIEESGESGEVEETWKRVRVTPGVELHMSCDLPKLKPAEVKKLLVLLEAALRKNRR